MTDPFEHIRNYYRVPARAGGKIRFRGEPGVIQGADRQYLVVQMNHEPSGETYYLHPTWEVEYLDD